MHLTSNFFSFCLHIDADEFSSQSISSTTEDILREADVLIAEVTEYRRELNETQSMFSEK